MIILMKFDKSLIISSNSRLYQKENVVDNVTIYVPSTYEEQNLSEYIATVSYTTSTNDAYMEILEQQESDKENYLMYKFPITSKFTNSAGANTMELTFTKNDEDTNTKHVLHSGELDVTICQWRDYYAYVPDSSLSAIDNKILELDAKADKLKSLADKIENETPNDLALTEDLLQLSRKDEDTGEVTLIGSGVEILIPGDKDDEDSAHDGVIDVDDLKDSDSDDSGETLSSSSGYQFIEL